RGGRRPAVSQPARRRDVAPEPPHPDESSLITLEELQQDRTISTFIASADRVMEGLGYTEHGFRHANLTGRIAFNVLARLDVEERTANLACIAGYLHDVGNMVARQNHAQIGALLTYDALKERMGSSDMAMGMAAVGNHAEAGGGAVSPIAAAVL